MKHLFLGAALLAATSANAQLNRVSLNVHTISGNKTFSEAPGSTQRTDNSGLNFLPTLGYHRIIKGNTGIGLEIGYAKSRTTYELRYAETIDRTRFSKTTNSSEEFFISPGIFEVITTPNRRYRIIPSLNLPIGYIPESKGSVEHTIVRNSDRDIYSASLTQSAPQQQLRIGLQAGVSAQVRVAGNFYAGIFLGGALTYYRQKITGDQVSVVSQQGQQPVRTTTPALDNLMQGYGFGIQPQINLNYFF